jgi:hypothetical protein
VLAASQTLKYAILTLPARATCLKTSRFRGVETASGCHLSGT